MVPCGCGNHRALSFFLPCLNPPGVPPALSLASILCRPLPRPLLLPRDFHALGTTMRCRAPAALAVAPPAPAVLAAAPAPTALADTDDGIARTGSCPALLAVPAAQAVQDLLAMETRLINTRHPHSVSGSAAME